MNPLVRSSFSPPLRRPLESLFFCTAWRHSAGHCVGVRACVCVCVGGRVCVCVCGRVCVRNPRGQMTDVPANDRGDDAAPPALQQHREQQQSQKRPPPNCVPQTGSVPAGVAVRLHGEARFRATAADHADFFLAVLLLLISFFEGGDSGAILIAP